MKIHVETEVAIGHRLLDYEGPCQYLHGHNYRVEAWIDSPPDWVIPPRGMLVDFSLVKLWLNTILERFDHAVMLRHDDPLAPLLVAEGQRVQLLLQNPTAEVFAHLVLRELYTSAPPSLDWRVRVWETAKNYAEV